MKHLFLIIFTILSISTLLTAQSDICQSLYIWEFADEKKQRTPITKMLTNEVEDALTSTACVILQRRNYARLSEQVDNEAAIQSLESISSPISNQLELAKAKVVLFGQVSQDFSGNLFLRVSFDNLENKQILLSSSMTLVSEEAYNLSKRREKIKLFIMSCVGQKVVSGDETFFWQQTKQLNTVEGYQSYLVKYPNGKYKSKANIILADEAEWKELLSFKNKDKRIRYLKKYLTNNRTQHLSEAKELLAELLWQKKRLAEYMQFFPDGEYATEDNIWKYGDLSLYLKHYPNGKYANEEEIWKIGNPDLYLENYPNGKYKSQIEPTFWKRVLAANDAIGPSKLGYNINNYLAHFPQNSSKVEEFLWGRVKSISPKEVFAEREIQEACEYYLKYFPNGKYAKAAKAKMGS